MLFRQVVLIVFCGLMVFAGHAVVSQAKESTTTFHSQSKAVTIDLYEPEGSGPYPGVVLLHGSHGLTDSWKLQIEEFARELAATGMVVVVPHYFDVTGTMPGAEVLLNIAQNRGMWLTATRDATAFLAKRSNVQKDRIALVGFSLGANLALDAAMMPPDGVTLRAVVDYFGPTVILDGDIKKLPPILIHHGLADRLVMPEHTKVFIKRLKDSGREVGADFDFHWYPDQEHGFRDAAALEDSKLRSIQFLRAHLK